MFSSSSYFDGFSLHMDIDLDHLKVFCEVARAGSLTAAGASLKRSQPSISRIIRILEERLGTKLFVRHATGLKRTSAGDMLYTFAKRMIEEASHIASLIQKDHAEVGGELRLVINPYICFKWLTEKLFTFIQNFPRIRLSMVEHSGPFDASLGDVAITFAHKNSPDLKHVSLDRVNFGFFASSKYLQEKGTPQSTADLIHHRLLSFVEPLPDGKRIDEIIFRAKEKPMPFSAVSLATSSLQSLVEATRAGFGIAVLPRFPSLKDAGYHEILTSCAIASVEISLLYPDHLEASKKVKALVRHLTNEL